MCSGNYFSIGELTSVVLHSRLLNYPWFDNVVVYYVRENSD